MGSLIHYPDFNSIAFAYDFIKKGIFGNTIEASQRILIPYIPSDTRILIIGGGTGQLLKEILDQKAVEKIVYVELSKNMIKAAQKKLSPEVENKVVFVHGAFALLDKEPLFDVIITPFVLDLYRDHELPELMNPLDKCLKEKGIWLCADFQVTATSVLGRIGQHCLMSLMYRFFSLTSKLKAKRLPDYEAVFEQMGYKNLAAHSFYGGLIWGRVFGGK